MLKSGSAAPIHGRNHGIRIWRAGFFAFSIVFAAFTPAAMAGEANVVDVKIHAETGGTYRFDVTVEHADEGWEHYADQWDVVDDAGNVFGSRKLLHPHVNEQPFARSLSGVSLPDGLTHVTIRAHDSVHGFGGREVTLPIPGRGDG